MSTKDKDFTSKMFQSGIGSMYDDKSNLSEEKMLEIIILK